MSKNSKHKSLGLKDYLALKNALALEEKSPHQTNPDQHMEQFEADLKKLLLTTNPTDYQKLYGEFEPTYFIYSPDDSKIFMRLMQLGCAGSVQAQRIFANLMNGLIKNQYGFRELLFTAKDEKPTTTPSRKIEATGPELLQRLLWCSQFNDLTIRKPAQDALDILTGNLEGFVFVY